MEMRTPFLRTGCIAAVAFAALTVGSPPIAAKGEPAAPIRPYGGSCSAVVTPLTPLAFFRKRCTLTLNAH